MEKAQLAPANSCIDLLVMAPTLVFRHAESRYPIAPLSILGHKNGSDSQAVLEEFVRWRGALALAIRR